MPSRNLPMLDIGGFWDGLDSRTILPRSFLHSGQSDFTYSALLLVRPLSFGALRPPGALSYCEALSPTALNS